MERTRRRSQLRRNSYRHELQPCATESRRARRSGSAAGAARPSSPAAGISRRAARSESDGCRSRSSAASRRRGGSVSSRPAVGELPRGLRLPVRGARRADEVRVVRVREPVRARARRADDRALLEDEHRVARACGREHVADRRRRPSRTRRRDAPRSSTPSPSPSRRARSARKTAPSTPVARISR